VKKINIDMFKIPSKMWDSIISNTIIVILIAVPILAMMYVSVIVTPLLVDDPGGVGGFLIFLIALIIGFSIAAYLIMVKENYDKS